MARLLADGSLDPSFTTTGSGFNGQLNALALQADGQVLAGGLFTSYNGSPRNYLARLNPDGSLNDVPTVVSGASFSWSPGGSTANPLVVTAAGTYTATAALPNGCSATGPAVLVRSGLPDLVVSTPQDVTGDYNNVTVTGPGTGGAGTATLTGPLTVAGTLTIQNGGALLTANPSLTGCQPITGAGNFVLEAGGTLGICAPDGISLSGPTGSVQVAGTRSYSDDATYIYLSPSVPQTTGNGLPALVRELRIDNAGHGAALTANVDLRQALRLTNGPLNLGGHTLTLRSTAAGTALVDNTGGNVLPGTGLGQMQRYLDPSLNPGLGYRHYSSPLLTTPVSQLATPGFAPVLTASYNSSPTPGLVQPFPTVFGYDQTRLGNATTGFSDFDKGWVVPGTWAVGTGLTVHLAPPALVVFSGEFNGLAQCDVALARGPQADAGYHLLGNPYPAPFDLNVPGATDGSNVGAAVYVYESTGPYTGQYRTVVNGIGSANPVLPAGQGFFVRSTAAGQPGFFRFKQAGRVTTFGAEPGFRRQVADSRPLVQLRLQAATGPADVTYVYADARATAQADGAFDAYKLLNPGHASLYALAPGGEPLAVQALPAFAATTVVPLALVLPVAGRITFTASLAQLPPGLTAYLLDAHTGTRQNLATTPAYTCTLATAGEVRGRFALAFGPASTALATAAPALQALVQLWPNPTTARAGATLTAPAGATATLCNALGQTVRPTWTVGPGATLLLPTTGLATGLYVLRVRTATGEVSRRLVVE